MSPEIFSGKAIWSRKKTKFHYTAQSPWEADQAEEGWVSDFPYREFCGSAIYLRTRPDCNFTISKLCKWMINPGPKMVAAAKRLLRYLKEYPDGGISFGINHFNSDTQATQDTMDTLFETGSLSGFPFSLDTWILIHGHSVWRTIPGYICGVYMSTALTCGRECTQVNQQERTGKRDLWTVRVWKSAGKPVKITCGQYACEGPADLPV